MTDRGKAVVIGKLCASMRGRPENWGLEDDALELAYSIGSRRIRNRALKRIADAVCTAPLDESP